VVKGEDATLEEKVSGYRVAKKIAILEYRICRKTLDVLLIGRELSWGHI
jgi:hypothetical protein